MLKIIRLLILLALLASTLESHFVLCSAPLLRIPAHLILAPRLLKHLKSVQVLHSHQVLLKVLTLELVVRTEAEDFLLFKLAHEYFFHLTMSQLAIIV